MAAALIRQADSLRQANSDDMAGSIFYLAPVDNASGKIFGKKQKFVAVRRKQGKRQRGCAAMGERSTKFSQDELARQERFGAVSVATKERLMDPNHLAADQVAFAKQSKFKTLRQYVWHQCAAEYDEANN